MAEKTGAVMCPASCATRLAAGPMSFAVRVPYQDNALFGAFTDTVYSHLARRFLDLIVIMSVNMVERMARPVCKRYLRADLISLRQRIRSQGSALAKMEVRASRSS